MDVPHENLRSARKFSHRFFESNWKLSRFNCRWLILRVSGVITDQRLLIAHLKPSRDHQINVLEATHPLSTSPHLNSVLVPPVFSLFTVAWNQIQHFLLLFYAGTCLVIECMPHAMFNVVLKLDQLFCHFPDRVCCHRNNFHENKVLSLRVQLFESRPGHMAFLSNSICVRSNVR